MICMFSHQDDDGDDYNPLEVLFPGVIEGSITITM